MPLIEVWLREGKPAPYRKAIAESIHRAMVDVMKIPEDDYFQVTYEMSAENLIYDANYFGVPRGEDMVLIKLAFNARPAAVKQRLFETIADNLVANPGLRREDIGMSIAETAFENWWAYARAVDPETGTDARMSKE